MTSLGIGLGLHHVGNVGATAANGSSELALTFGDAVAAWYFNDPNRVIDTGRIASIPSTIGSAVLAEVSGSGPGENADFGSFVDTSTNYLNTTDAAIVALANGDDPSFTVMVYGTITLSSNDTITSFGDQSAATPYDLWGLSGGANRYNTNRNDGASNVGTATASPTGKQLHTLVADGTTRRFYQSGTAVGTATVDAGNITAIDQFSVGALVRSTVANPITMDCYVVWLFNGVVSAANVAAASTALDALYP